MGDPSCSATLNFYSLLGIRKSASLSDISKAYKSLVLKWHPDKNLSNKAEAEAKFRAIHEAYRALSTKKREEEENKVVAEPTTPENSFHHRRKPQPIVKKLECTLEELCRGCVKNIKITRDAISDTGLIVQEEETLKIKVKPGWKNGTKITFEGKGDERPGTLPADIILLIDEKRHPVFKRVGDDLEFKVEISLMKSLTGCTIVVPLLGGEKMTLSFEDIIYPGFEKKIPDQGMPKSKEQGRRGDLRLKFLVNFPKELSDEQRSGIHSILNGSS